MSLVVPPYPPPRYTADEPEVSAWLKRGDAAPDYDAFGLVQYHYLAGQGDTGGQSAQRSDGELHQGRPFRVAGRGSPSGWWVIDRTAGGSAGTWSRLRSGLRRGVRTVTGALPERGVRAAIPIHRERPVVPRRGCG